MALINDDNGSDTKNQKELEQLYDTQKEWRANFIILRERMNKRYEDAFNNTKVLRLILILCVTANIGIYTLMTYNFIK